MKFTEILTPDNIRQGMVYSSKKTMFESIGRMVESKIAESEFPSSQCFAGLFNREKLGCTGLGNGVAMPRAKLPVGDKAIAIFLQLSEPLDYDALDKRDVDLIFVTLIPEGMCSQYISVLEEFSQRLTDKSLCKQLRAAQSADEIWQIFEYADKAFEQQNEQQSQQQNQTEQTE
ncbi:phosphotransferase IIA-like nitrogen-regulatory protein PtsN [Pasteurella langaaensis DSM 22999]|uniref:Phosphotransferase IIA-like nitrogen-regulatory protein PtsN n=1 Tax=Alitibacter langaaensis DSM 22999 TaxID=1122935 RepID=A0A2U0TGZ6_9PAST|nr:PTS IIA-like nitrogen regulatory protein PtsN [Pasteurella langaaensis]PVX42882.1 phosphotransferase IIA-like nitrogen-regulatory protein PtsN [Pasteurella langaaensis DSM 22999]